MADGGATEIIMLIAALLVAGAASAVLVQSWSGTAQILSDNQTKSMLDSKTKVTFSGDLNRTEYSDPANTMTVYLQNSGSSVLNQSEAAFFLNGTSAAVSANAFLSGATIWGPGVVVSFTIDVPAATYQDAQEYRITAVVLTLASQGAVGTDSVTEVVRLG